MNARLGSYLLALAVVVGLLLVSMSAAGGGGSAARVEDMPRTVFVPDQALGEPIRPPDHLAQVGCERLTRENFETSPFPPTTGSKWSTSDRCAIFPGQGDVYKWGRTECDASSGRASLWSVGGGAGGSALTCGATYPAAINDPRRQAGCTRVDTLLRYFYFDCSSLNYALRVTFDYKGKMPDGALRIAVGPRNDDGSITFTQQFSDFQADTGGQWVRGAVREFTAAAGVKQLVLGVFYVDDTKTAGLQGVMIDNMLFDLMQEQTCPLIGSPTVPSTVTETPEPATLTPTRVPPTKTRTPTPSPSPTPKRIKLSVPQVLRRYDLGGTQPPRPTVPTPTRTLSPTPTVPPTPIPTETQPPTRTPHATRTLRPTETPTRTPYPTPTEVPKPNVKITQIMPRSLKPGEDLEIVKLENLGTAEQPLDGWRLFNKSHSKTCRFPAGVIIQPADYYEVRSGSDAVADDHGTVCSDNYIWDDKKDQGELYDEFNRMVSCYAYDENGVFDCMPSP